MSDTDLAFRATLDGSGFATGMQGLEGSLNRFGIQTNSATANIGGLGTVIGTLANPATAAALGITAVGSAIATSISTAGDFQQKMAGVNAILGGSAADMQTLSTAAREAGASTSFSASQAADALGYMAGAGWDVQQSTVALKDTLTLAAAGGMDLAAAGDLMTGTVAQFGLEATDAARVSNTLAAGASATNTSVSALGQGMTVVGATANAFGMSLESTTAALGSLSNANIKGAEGGTALRGILASLATQSGTASAALAELGVTNEQVNPEMVSLGDAMQLLQDRGMTASQAIQIFGRENVSAATYMAAHASELDGLEQSITGTSKSAEMAATMTDTYQGAMGELSSAVEEAEIALGSVLLPVVTQTIDLMTAGVTAATDFGKSIYDAIQPEGSVGSIFASSDAWLAENFGFPTGEAAAEGIAEGIEENTDTVAASIEEATGGADALAAVASSGADTGDKWVKSFGEAASKGMTLVNGKWTSQAAAVADTITDQTIYMNDQEYTLRSINSGENMIYQIRQKSTGELIEQTKQIRQTNDLITAQNWATSQGYDTQVVKTLRFDFIYDKAAALKTMMADIGEQAATALKDNIIDVTEQDTLTALVAEFISMGGDASDALIAAIKSKQWDAVGREVGSEISEGLTDSMTGTKYTEGETQPLSEILKTGGSSAIADWKQWSENVFQPALKTSFDEMHAIQDNGYNADIAQTEEWITDKISLLEDYGEAFTDDQVELLSKWENRLITTKEFYDQWAEIVTEGTETVYDTIEYNDELFYGSVADTTKNWTDYVNEFGGYVGPTDQRYVDYVKNTKTDRVDEATKAYEELKELGWEGVGVGSINVAFETTMDTTEASMSATELVKYVESADPTMTLLLDTTVADARFQNLFNLIQNSNPVMQVQVAVDAYQIRAAVQAAIAEAIQNA